MSGSYNSSAVSSDLDRVRFLVGDTDMDDILCQDGEINFVISNHGGNVFLAAADVAEAIAAKFARKCDKAVGDLQLSLSQKSEAYRDMSDRLRTHGSILCVPTAGGISISEKEAAEDDTDRFGSPFSTDQFSHPGLGGTGSSELGSD